jgi:hypothetical protein
MAASFRQADVGNRIVEGRTRSMQDRHRRGSSSGLRREVRA